MVHRIFNSIGPISDRPSAPSRGIEAGRRETSDTDFAARFGGGIDCYLTEAIALQISSSYVLQTGGLDGLDYLSLIAGVQYRF